LKTTESAQPDGKGNNDEKTEGDEHTFHSFWQPAALGHWDICKLTSRESL
jgi:hypothetical protein